MKEPKKERKNITVRYWPIKKKEHTKTYPPHCQVGMCENDSVIIEERFHGSAEFDNKTSLLYLCEIDAAYLIGEEQVTKLIGVKKNE